MRTFALPFLALAAACSAADDEAPADTDVDPVAVASAPGPYTVGHLLTEVTYPSVTEGGADRTLPVEVWYPAEPGSHGIPVTYLIMGLVQVPAPLAVEQVDVASDGPFPVAVYSHGSGGLGVLAYPYAERLASHGWIVLSADHVGNTTYDLLAGAEEPYVRMLADRPADVSAQLDAAASLPGLEGAADPEQAYVFGHSFGGYTSFAAAGTALDVDALVAACEGGSTDPSCPVLEDDAVRAFLADPGDDRVDAIAPQAPGGGAWAGGALAGLDTPVLLMSGARDITVPDAEAAAPDWDALDGADDLWLHLPDGGHYTFISICDDVGAEVIATVQDNAEDDGCGGDFIPTLEAIPAMATYLLAFGEVHVRGHEAFRAVLDGPSIDDGIDVVRP